MNDLLFMEDEAYEPCVEHVLVNGKKCKNFIETLQALAGDDVHDFNNWDGDVISIVLDDVNPDIDELSDKLFRQVMDDDDNLADGETYFGVGVKLDDPATIINNALVDADLVAQFRLKDDYREKADELLKDYEVADNVYVYWVEIVLPIYTIYKRDWETDELIELGRNSPTIDDKIVYKHSRNKVIDIYYLETANKLYGV